MAVYSGRILTLLTKGIFRKGDNGARIVARRAPAQDATYTSSGLTPASIQLVGPSCSILLGHWPASTPNTQQTYLSRVDVEFLGFLPADRGGRSRSPFHGGGPL